MSEPIGARVVIRSSWLATFALASPALIVFLGIWVWQRWFSAAFLAAVFVVVFTTTTRLLHYTELTASGLDIHKVAATRVPWGEVGAVEQVRKWGGSELYVYDLAQNRRRHLTAPRAAFGVGQAEQTQARELIEQWWVTYRGAPPPAAPPRAPYPPSAEDPYRPPAQD